MADYLLEIAENEKHLCIQRGCVIIKQNKEVIGQIPIDVLAAVILSADGITMSKHFFARMAEENIPVVICGKKYIPLSIMLPYDVHYRTLPVVTAQMQASPVLKKQLWQQIIVTKIKNQAHVLAQHHPEHEAIAKLQSLAQKVRSGDSDNKEAQAARAYWPALMGKGFTRDQHADGINVFLNYGYAVVRAACARALCAAGLLPLLGVHHHNSYNAFCLADDIMEPLRPFVDALVLSCCITAQLTELTADHKKKIAHILHTPFPYGGEEHILASITTKMAQGLAKCFLYKNSGLLPLPCAFS